MCIKKRSLILLNGGYAKFAAKKQPCIVSNAKSCIAQNFVKKWIGKIIKHTVPNAFNIYVLKFMKKFDILVCELCAYNTHENRSIVIPIGIIIVGISQLKYSFTGDN